MRDKEKEGVKLLLHFSVEGVLISMDQVKKKDIKIKIEKISGIDLHRSNQYYKYFLNIEKGISVNITQHSMQYKEGNNFIRTLLQNRVHLTLTPFTVTLAKPFVERLSKSQKLVVSSSIL